MKILLISTYELGRQPFGLAWPAAWLVAQGHEVACADLSVQSLPEETVRRASLVALYLPMHTGTRRAALCPISSIRDQSAASSRPLKSSGIASRPSVSRAKGAGCRS